MPHGCATRFPFFFFLPILQVSGYTSTFNFTSSYAKLEKTKFCRPQCYYKESLTTLETIQNFPKGCLDVCGILVLNEESDVPMDVWKEKLKKMERLKGGIYMYNSGYVDVSFLPSDVYIFSDEAGISFVNNTKLQNVNILLNLIPQGIKSFQVYDNLLLDATELCNSVDFEPGWKISGNKINCDCRGEKLTSKSILKYENCEHIGGSLVITQLDPNQVPPMANVKKIGGTLEVKNTDLKNLSFFKSLEEISYTSNLSDNKIIINVHDNPEMTRLGIQNLKALGTYYYGHYVLNFQNLHPEFCLSIWELSLFIDYLVEFRRLEARFCSDLTWSIDKPKLCAFDKMVNLDINCIYIFGHVVVESGDEAFVRKLKAVRRVFGTVEIRNTILENCNFLRQLEKIVNLDDTPTMQFIGNALLKNLELPVLKPFITRTPSQNQVILESNHPEIFRMTRNCMKFQAMAKTKIVYNGKDCKSINRTLPSEVGHDFDNVDYSEDYDYNGDYSDSFKPWYDEYDGEFYYIDLTDKVFKIIFQTLKTINNVISVIGLIVNVFHLLVLLQKGLRDNFVYMMMIGTCLCDILLVSTLLTKFLMGVEWTKFWKAIGIFKIKDKTKNPGYKCVPWSYSSAVFDIIYPRILTMARRCSSLLIFFMAVFRTLAIVLPMSANLERLTRPRYMILLILGLTAICAAWDASLALRCEIKSSVYGGCKGVLGYFADCPEDDKYDDDKIQIAKTSTLIDAFSTLLIVILYLIVTIILLYHLRKAYKRRKALSKAEQSDSTLLLVTVMAIAFFVSEVIFGSSFIVRELSFANYPVLQDIIDESQVASWTILIINSLVHCAICLSMSSQYRTAAKDLFRCGGKKNKVQPLPFVKSLEVSGQVVDSS